MLRIEVFAEGSPRINFHRSHGALRFNEGQTRRSEEHTSELQSQSNLVCRLLLEKKKKEHTIRRQHQTSDPPPQLTLLHPLLLASNADTKYSPVHTHAPHLNQSFT